MVLKRVWLYVKTVLSIEAGTKRYSLKTLFNSTCRLLQKSNDD
jgi:hypothetical protein